MDLYTLVIKGERSQAEWAAAKHNIPAVFMYEVEGGAVLLTRADVSELAAWYAQYDPLIKGFDPPIGTLLNYSHHPDATVELAVANAEDLYRLADKLTEQALNLLDRAKIPATTERSK